MTLPAPKSPEQAQQDAARFAHAIYTLGQGLPRMAQPVLRSWLRTQASGKLGHEITEEALFTWLAGMRPDLAEAEYRLALVEISWLAAFTAGIPRSPEDNP